MFLESEGPARNISASRAWILFDPVATARGTDPCPPDRYPDKVGTLTQPLREGEEKTRSLPLSVLTRRRR